MLCYNYCHDHLVLRYEEHLYSSRSVKVSTHLLSLYSHDEQVEINYAIMDIKKTFAFDFASLDDS